MTGGTSIEKAPGARDSKGLDICTNHGNCGTNAEPAIVEADALEMNPRLHHVPVPKGGLTTVDQTGWAKAVCGLSQSELAEAEEIRSAVASISADSTLANSREHTASNLIGFGLNLRFGVSHWPVGAAIAAEWDARTGGNATAVFRAADPLYSATKPVTVDSIYRLARDCGWVPTNDRWLELLPLIEKLEPKPYPIASLPKIVRCAVEEVTEFVQAPTALVAMSALAALSISIQALADVQRADRLSGPCSLFLLAIAGSGERKSSCDGYFTTAVREYQDRKREQSKAMMSDFQSAYEAWESNCAGVKEQIKHLSKKGQDTHELAAKLAELHEKKPARPRVPRLIFGDVTPEALAYSLATQWPAGAIVSAEAGIVFGSRGMIGDSVMRNLAMLNQLWDGGVLTIDRRTSDSFAVEGARLTMALQVQPQTIDAFLAGSNGMARGTGFLARFLLAWPESTQGFRAFREAPKKWPGLDAFNARLTSILETPTPIDANGALRPYMLDLRPDAKAAWVDFHDRIEAALSKGGELHDVSDVASKLADNAARLAALFHTFSGADGPIGLDAMTSACTIAEWHVGEARRYLCERASPAELLNPEKLEIWLVDYCLNEKLERVPIRKIQQFGPASVRDRKSLLAAVRELTLLGRARLARDGRVRSVELNPKLLVGLAGGGS